MAKIAKKKMPQPQPTPQAMETVPVAVIEETLRGSDLTLADGTMLTVKPQVQGVRRAVGATDSDGRPVYTVQCGLQVQITVAGSTK